MARTWGAWTLAVLASLVLVACDSRSPHAPDRSVTLVSGSENKSLFPIVQEFAEDQGIDLHIRGLGSVDIMLDIRRGTAAQADRAQDHQGRPRGRRAASRDQPRAA